MSLLLQIQVAVISFFFGAFFLLLFGFINRLFYRITIIKNFCIILYFMIMSSIYFVLLVHFTDGVLRIYYPLFMLLGGFIYQKIYAKYFLKLYDKILNKINHIFIRPIHLKIKQIQSILKMKRKKRLEKRQNGKRKRKKEKSYN